MARILAISSQVARGHVGLSAIVPALQMLGHDVTALPTILLSNHPGHARAAGERVAPELLRRMLDALEKNGWLGDIDAILTGYLPSVEHVRFARDVIDRLRAHSAAVRVLCDPVIGDEPKGVYIAADAAAAIRELLVPVADVLKLNRFELAFLSDAAIVSSDDVATVAGQCRFPVVVATSLPGPAPDTISNALAVDGRLVGEVRVRRLERVPNGTGDLLSALQLGLSLLENVTPGEAFVRAVDVLGAVVEASAGRAELSIPGVLPAAIRAVCGSLPGGSP